MIERARHSDVTASRTAAGTSALISCLKPLNHEHRTSSRSAHTLPPLARRCCESMVRCKPEFSEAGGYIIRYPSLTPSLELRLVLRLWFTSQSLYPFRSPLLGCVNYEQIGYDGQKCNNDLVINTGGDTPQIPTTVRYCAVANFRAIIFK